MAPLSAILAAVLSAGALASHHPGVSYDPEHPSEPFDAVANTLSDIMTSDGSRATHSLVKTQFLSGGGFCECVENGYVAGWYQYGSAMYLVDQCSPSSGLVLRTGHLQDRHTEPLVGMMACDTLKLLTYCTSKHMPGALGGWKATCDNAHYTVPSCDVQCSAAPAGAAPTALAAILAALAALRLGM